MENLEAIKVETFPLNDLVKIADLIYFEGAILSLFKNSHGDNYLYYWCDCDEISNRWLVFKVSQENLDLYMNQKKTLRELLLYPSEGFIYVIDINDELDYNNINLLTPAKLPDSYIPDPDSFYEFTPIYMSDFESIKQDLQPKFALCLNNKNYEVSLEIGKLYRVIDDQEAKINGLIRIIDESGEDYAFSADRFYPIELPHYVEEALMII